MLLVCLVLLLSSDHISAAANWVEVTSIGATKGWYGIASSADGTKLAAVVDGHNIWTSNNTGATWTEDTSVNATKGWRAITSSADGTKLAAVARFENIWTSKLTNKKRRSIVNRNRRSIPNHVDAINTP